MMDRRTFLAYANRTDITREDMPDWFRTVRDVLQAAYTAAATPWEQSGKSGTYEDWVRLRLPLSELIQRDGTVLDIGCANGFLLECLLAWTAAKGVSITPYGIDMGEQLVQLARARLPEYAANILAGNAWDWQPAQNQTFDFVRTELVYVPSPFRRQYIERLLTDYVSPGGLLIVAHYRSSQDDLTRDWADEQLAAWGYSVEQITRGFSGKGLEQTRFASIRRG